MMDSAPWRNLALPPDDGGYLAVPTSGEGPGVVVVHEWWGLNDQLARTCDRLAAEGFTALAPDLYRGRSTDVPDEGRALSGGLEAADGLARTLRAVEHLAGDARATGSRVGVMGYCMGGGYVLMAAAAAGERVGAAVPFYGLPKAGIDAAAVRCDVLGHYGDQDRVTTPEAARELAGRIRAAAGVEARVVEYPGAGHAFCNEEGATYSPENAARAWATTLAFLRRRLA